LAEGSPLILKAVKKKLKEFLKTSSIEGGDWKVNNKTGLFIACGAF